MKVSKIKLWLNSNLISSAEYVFEQKLLIIKFVSGKVYEYYNVWTHVFLGLMFADSAGQYFHDKIKDKFEYEEVKDDIQTTD